MKRLHLYILLLLFNTTTAQQISAVYNVKVSYSGGYSLNYESRFYITGNKSAQFLIPLYLDDYPDSLIQITKELSYGIPMDSIQEYMVVDTDSGILRISYPIKFEFNEYHTFEMGSLLWEIFPEVRMVNGLKCQRAVCRNKIGGSPIGEIWFTPDVPVSLGINGLRELPGLIVEMNWQNGMYRASLLTYDVISLLPKDVFWPSLYNRPFKFGGHSKRIKTESD